MHDVIHFHASTTPAKKAIIDLHTGESYDYRHADQRISQIASFLLKATKGERGGRVAMISRNSAFMLLVHYACERAGLVFVPLNWRLAPPEIAVLIEDAQPSVLLWQIEFDALAAPGLDIVEKSCQFVITDSGEAFAKDEPDDFVPNEEAAENDPITLLYTSGTSGKSKGVILTHKTVHYSALNFALSSGVTRDTVFLCDMPLFHVAGLLAVSRTPIFYGGTVLVSQKFDPLNTFKNLTDPALGVTHYFCVTQMAALIAGSTVRTNIKRLSACPSKLFQIKMATSASGRINRYDATRDAAVRWK